MTARPSLPRTYGANIVNAPIHDPMRMDAQVFLQITSEVGGRDPPGAGRLERGDWKERRYPGRKVSQGGAVYVFPERVLRE